MSKHLDQEMLVIAADVLGSACSYWYSTWRRIVMRDNAIAPMLWIGWHLEIHLQIPCRSPFPSNSRKDLNNLNLIGGLLDRQEIYSIVCSTEHDTNSP